MKRIFFIFSTMFSIYTILCNSITGYAASVRVGYETVVPEKTVSSSDIQIMHNISKENFLPKTGSNNIADICLIIFGLFLLLLVIIEWRKYCEKNK